MQDRWVQKWWKRRYAARVLYLPRDQSTYNNIFGSPDLSLYYLQVLSLGWLGVGFFGSGLGCGVEWGWLPFLSLEDIVVMPDVLRSNCIQALRMTFLWVTIIFADDSLSHFALHHHVNCSLCWDALHRSSNYCLMESLVRVTRSLECVTASPYASVSF